jgi:hypothetical protein
MKGIDLLIRGCEYTVRTQFEEYQNLVFTGFWKENDDVTLACFVNTRSGLETFFDTDVPSNAVVAWRSI